MIISPRYLLTICFSMFILAIQGQTIDLEEGPAPWEAGLNLGLNKDGYRGEMNLTYFKSQYLGLKVGLGFAGEIWELEDWLVDDVIDYEYDRDYDYTIRFIFNPAIVLRSPRIINWKQQEAGIYLFTEPGLIMSPGASGSRNAKWLRWDVKGGVNLQFNRFIFTLGYDLSNFSLYSGGPENHWGQPDKTEYLTHTIYVGGSVKF